MRITLKAPDNEFIKRLYTLLKDRQSEDTVTLSGPNEQIPADTELLVGLGKITAETLAPLKQLKLLHTASDGYDAVDVDAATEDGIWVSYSPGDETGNAASVAEFAVLLLLATARKLKQALEAVHGQGTKPMLNTALVGSTICIVGFGDIGQQVAKRLAGFEAKIIAVDHHPPEHAGGVEVYKSVDEALPQADFVVMCVRGSEENEHMVNAGFLAKMKKTAVLVNIARGSLVDEQALLAALKGGKLAGAGLDVTEHEPIDPKNPLLVLPNTFITPHIAGFTELTAEGTAKYVGEVADNLRAGRKFKSLLNAPQKPRLELK